LAFTLLIFFLVVTSMDTDEGLARLLPRWVPEDQIQDQEIKKRNILNVMVNKDNAILMGDDYIEGSVEKQNEQIRKKAIEFITATGQFAGDRGPEMKEVDPEKSPELMKLIVAKDPTVRVAKSHVISLQSDYGTSYEKYIQLQNELVAAYNTLRQEAAQKYFQKDYDEEVLSQDEAKALKDLYPMNISEANAKY
jgi:biopolymer transport protein ExbD